MWKTLRGTNVSSNLYNIWGRKNLYYIKWALYKFMEFLAFLNRFFFLNESNGYLVLLVIPNNLFESF